MRGTHGKGLRTGTGRVAMLVLAGFAIASAVWAEETAGVSLPLSTREPTVDGVVNPGEYAYTKNFGPMTVSVSRTADALYLAVVSETTGWVGIGIGPLKMDGATIFMGFVDKDGNVQFKPQAGFNHTHKDATATVTATIISSAMKEVDGKTTLEVALKSAAYIAAGQHSLDLIFAEGAADSFSPYHDYRGFMSLTLAP